MKPCMSRGWRISLYPTTPRNRKAGFLGFLFLAVNLVSRPCRTVITDPRLWSGSSQPGRGEGFSLPAHSPSKGKGICYRFPLWRRWGMGEDPETCQSQRGLPCEILPGLGLPFPNSSLFALRVIWADLTLKDENSHRPLY